MPGPDCSQDFEDNVLGPVSVIGLGIYMQIQSRVDPHNSIEFHFALADVSVDTPQLPPTSHIERHVHLHMEAPRNIGRHVNLHMESPRAIRRHVNLHREAPRAIGTYVNLRMDAPRAIGT